MQDAIVKAQKARNIYSFQSAFGFDRKDIVVRPGRRIVFQGELARVIEVKDTIAVIKFDNYETVGVTMLSVIRNMREVISRDSIN